LSLPRLEGAKMVGSRRRLRAPGPDAQRQALSDRRRCDVDRFFSKTWTATPRPIAIDLLVGPDALLRGKESRLALPKPVQPDEGRGAPARRTGLSCLP